jgi:hypothetical protein
MLSSVRLEIVLLLMQDWCTVCVARTVVLEIALEAHDGTLGEVGHVESCFNLFWDSVSVGAR